MFCDFYNMQTKMYCKRLKVMCPEHEKEKKVNFNFIHYKYNNNNYYYYYYYSMIKVNENEVCGCPLPNQKNLLTDSNDICLAPKRTCSIHFKWEKMRRAHIDLEKLRIVSLFKNKHQFIYYFS